MLERAMGHWYMQGPAILRTSSWSLPRATTAPDNRGIEELSPLSQYRWLIFSHANVQNSILSCGEDIEEFNKGTFTL